MQGSWEMVRTRMAEAQREADTERLAAAVRHGRSRPARWWLPAGIERTAHAAGRRHDADGGVH